MSTDNQKNPEVTKDQQKPTPSEEVSTKEEKSASVSLNFSELEDRIAPARIV